MTSHMQNLDKPFLTRDLYLASYLCYKGMTLLDPTPVNGDEPRLFVMVDREDREQLVENWVAGIDDALTCKLYAGKLRMVKRALYGTKERG